MAFSRPTLGALIRDAQGALAAQLAGTDPLLRRSNLGVLARVFAGLTHLVFGYLDWIFRQVLPDTAEGEYLDRWCRLYGLTRKAATLAAGTVTLTGTDGAVLAAGVGLTASDGTAYATLAAATVAAGTASVGVQAVLGDSGGNAATGTTLGLVVAVPGLYGSAIVEAPGLAGGGPAESDAELRARLLARIRQPPQGGSAADYVAWALAVPGVTRAWVYPLNRGAGTVDLTFVMDGRAATGGSLIPLSADQVAVQAAIDAQRPVCDDCIVFLPTPAPLNVTLGSLRDDTSAVRTVITAELAAQIIADATPGGTVYRSRLDEAISRATGESSHTLTVPSGDLTAPAGTIYVPGTVTIL